MRYHLRTLMVLLAVMPPALAFFYWSSWLGVGLGIIAFGILVDLACK